MKFKLRYILIVFLLLNSAVFSVWAEDISFTIDDRDRLIRLENTLKEFKDSVNKRFEQVDKRVSELREDMNKRFEDMFNFLSNAVPHA